MGNFPQLSTHLRIIDTIDSCLMPPVVAAQRLGSVFLEKLQSALCKPDRLQAVMKRSHI
ncbi:MAG: hypothetical protein WBG73_10285 [Coleofasciculaceae cyanobacterium]